ncbi:glycoside hydrolase family 16 protein [Crucibulum laeve]|uniref:Glycoside hydrolase family 16 protein n=1 Tax=Crucibulum laeve TaxID=68775 RepID=A0A5C3MH90_9AGAR|nr:glycoside hydrolase family 16 protein [Crucibulum laeve]
MASSSSSTPRPGFATTDSNLPLLRLSSFGDVRRESWFTLGPDPSRWGFDVTKDGLVDPDDDLHDPTTDPTTDPATTNECKKLFNVSLRGFANVGCLALLCAIFLALFIGYPVVTYAKTPRFLPRINSTGQVPSMGNFGLIDQDTPLQARRKASAKDGTEMILVFSDEFNTNGRSFYPGDDPYWEAADLHYWATNNKEWYDPEAVTTVDGSLVITFSEKQTHDLNFQGGRNKFCFTGGYFEASVQLPGVNNVAGMWPAVWTMGNLGRAGYGATLEGMWPYTYDSCDVGTAPNQTRNGLPYDATVNGDHLFGYALSWLPGQKLSRCTCDGESHPGPKHPDGTYVGRSSPEIDMIEAQVGGKPHIGQVSQSAQWAPFDRSYLWDNSSDNMIVMDPSISKLNGFIGSATQQATSVVTNTNQLCYEYVEDCYSVYGFEYKPGYDDAYITWVSDNKISWTLNAGGVGPDSSVEISARPVPQEPMYMIINLGMSENFGAIDFDHLIFPNHLRVDYVRVYQRADAINIGCSPKDFPTEDYINKYIEAYTNPNLTTWRADYGQPFPKNSFMEPC